MARDKTKELISKAKMYIDGKSSENSEKIQQKSVRYIYGYYIKKCLGLAENTVVINDEKVKVWQFVPDCEYLKGDVSASQIAALLVKYRRALKSLGAIHKDFIPSLNIAKKQLINAGLDKHIVDGLNPKLRLETLEERIEILKRKHPRGAASGKGMMIHNAINSIKIYHPSYYRLAGAVSYVKAITNQKQKTRLKEKHDKKIRFNPDFLLRKARAVLDNKHAGWVELTVALCAVTGRRPTEIIKTAKLWRDRQTPENYMRFSGLLKSRDRKLDDDFGVWDIPVFHDEKIIIKAIRKVRKEIRENEKRAQDEKNAGNHSAGGYLQYINQKGEDVTVSIYDSQLINDVDHNMAVNKQYNRPLNEELRRWFESGDIAIKSLRAIYTKMVWEREKDSSSETYDSMTTRVLCYSKSSLSEAVKHYAAIELSDKVEKIEIATDKNEASISHEELSQKLYEADDIIEKRSVRAPALKRIHGWLKEKKSLGFKLNELTTTYIRKHCLVGGKKIDSNTAKLYLDLVGISETMISKINE